MNENIVEIKGLCKEYKEFQLKDITFSIPKGYIMGFIGENGAGKSTTIKLILNLVKKDVGEISIFGKDNIEFESEIKEDIGVVYSELNLNENFTAKDMNRIMKHLYVRWDESIFVSYLKRFELKETMQIKKYSSGMRMKLSIAMALSHQAKLLIMDEPTSGLDPIVRDEILDIFLEFMQNEEHSILVSSHIISDLEKIADYIALIHKGKMLFCEEKECLLEEYAVLKCTKERYRELDPSKIVGSRENAFGMQVLMKKCDLERHLLEEEKLDKVNLEDIMFYFVKGEGK